MIKRLVQGLGVVALLVLLANYSWVHAALVISDEHGCPEGLVKQAQTRLAGFYPDVLSTPYLVCLPQPTLGLGHIIGTTHFAPGLPAIIVLNPDGQNVDVLAHEWAHAEFASRVGVLTRTYQVPTWFDEGLAMQVDWRDSYTDAAMAELLQETGHRPVLEEISSLNGFIQPGKQGRLNYAFSRCVVAQMLRSESLQSFLEQPSIDRQPDVSSCSSSP